MTHVPLPIWHTSQDGVVQNSSKCPNIHIDRAVMTQKHLGISLWINLSFGQHAFKNCYKVYTYNRSNSNLSTNNPSISIHIPHLPSAPDRAPPKSRKSFSAVWCRRSAAAAAWSRTWTPRRCVAPKAHRGCHRKRSDPKIMQERARVNSVNLWKFWGSDWASGRVLLPILLAASIRFHRLEVFRVHFTRREPQRPHAAG